MLDHIDITVKDLNRSKEFYRPLLSALGINGFSSDINGVKFYDKKDYIWIGSKTDVEQMIGNAVPVNLASFVAETVKLAVEEDSRD